MKAVMTEIPQFILDWRRQTGADRFDEMWEGVLHMNPPPDVDHQDLEGAIESWLRQHWKTSEQVVLHQVAVSPDDDWTNNYRVPDLILIAADRIAMRRETYFHGGPTVVVELRSPGDESYEKLPFYAELGVPEVWVIDRDTKSPELYILTDGNYQKYESASDDWQQSAATGIEFRGTKTNKIAMRLAANHATLEELP